MTMILGTRPYFQDGHKHRRTLLKTCTFRCTCNKMVKVNGPGAEAVACLSCGKPWTFGGVVTAA